MGKLSEGVGIGVKTESVSRLSVAQVGLALHPGIEDSRSQSKDMWALAVEGWAPSLMCPTHETSTPSSSNHSVPLFKAPWWVQAIFVHWCISILSSRYDFLVLQVDLCPFKKYLEVLVLPQNPERRLYLGIAFLHRKPRCVCIGLSPEGLMFLVRLASLNKTQWPLMLRMQ